MPNPNWMPTGRYGVNDAIASLRPGAMYQLENRTFKKWWHHSDAPTWKEIMDESDRLKAIAYQSMRAEAYPSITEFADAFYWQQKGILEPMQKYLASVEVVKNNFPKPTQEQLDSNIPYSEE